MKTRLTLLVALMMIGGSSVMAQGLLGKVVKAAETAKDVNSTVNSVNGAVGTAEQAAGAVNQLKGLFGSKKKKEAEAAAAAAAAVAAGANGAAIALPAGMKLTIVTVSGIDYATLKKFNESIQACGNVSETKVKFNSTASTIDVVHKESTDNLLKLMQETGKDIFTDKNIEGIEEGKITLKLK